MNSILTPEKMGYSFETFPNPFTEPALVHIETDEFTCLCPKTGQPDFATIILDYVPETRCVELKSLKLYYWSFRNACAFHEKVTDMIADALQESIEARYLRVHARFNVRGGVYTNVVVERGSDRPLFVKEPVYAR